jgi:hypothetical protein
MIQPRTQYDEARAFFRLKKELVRDRDLLILEAYGSGESPKKLGDKFDLSGSRIRQIAQNLQRRARTLIDREKAIAATKDTVNIKGLPIRLVPLDALPLSPQTKDHLRGHACPNGRRIMMLTKDRFMAFRGSNEAQWTEITRVRSFLIDAEADFEEIDPSKRQE